MKFYAASRPLYLEMDAGPHLYMADWLPPKKHTENLAQEITGMNINVHATCTPLNMPIYTSIENIQAAT